MIISWTNQHQQQVLVVHKSWQEANNILFDAASLYPTRLNFTLPYMNDVTIVGKDGIPKKLDIHNLITKDQLLVMWRKQLQTLRHF